MASTSSKSNAQEKVCVLPQSFKAASKDKIHASVIKSKVKSHRPIILLRRNSSGNIQAAGGKNGKMPRLKSMSEIEIKPKPVLQKCASPKVKIEKIAEYPTFQALQSPGELFVNSAMPAANSGMDVKLEPMQAWPATQLNQPTHASDMNFSTQSVHGITMPNSGQTFIKEDIGEMSNNTSYLTPNNNFFPNSGVFPNTSNQTFVPFQEDFSNPHQMQTQQCYINNLGQPAVNNCQQFSGIPFANNLQQPTFHQHQPMQYFNPNQQMHIGTNFNGCPIDDSLTNITWLGQMGVNNFMPVPLELERKYSEQRDRRGRPPYSYMALIQFAINSSTTGRMTLRQIYQWIEDKFPYFKTAKPGWKNSIRHNLSLHDIFVREVAAGSKASYWTLRSDLNVRPLTLESLRGGAQHSFQDCNPNKFQPQQQQATVWNVPQTPGQKPLLPRLPHCSKPYVFLPVPLLQNQVIEKKITSTPAHVNQAVEPQQTEFENLSQETTVNSSSFFADSGFHSDMSHSTPSGSGLKLTTPGSLDRIILTPHSGKDFSPTLSQVNAPNKTSNQKQSRKQPLETLNDSLNSSLHFVKQDSSEGDSPQLSPRRRPLSPSGAQFLLCKKLHKQSTRRAHSSDAKSAPIGLSDDSFNEILNDLGSPFKGIFSQDFPLAKSSPKATSSSNRKRRRSWGSPESSYSGGATSSSTMCGIRSVNETTPSSQQIRRVKSEAGDLMKLNVADEVKLPSSTPLVKEKWKKSLNYRSCIEDLENQENQPPINTEAWNLISRPPPMRTPSPIRSSKSQELDSHFLNDIMGSMFKTPERPTAPVRHFDSLSPGRTPFADITSQQQQQQQTDDVRPAVTSLGGGNFLSTPLKLDVLDSSFSKLLDISGGSGGFPRTNTHFSDMTDLNLSWSSITQL